MPAMIVEFQDVSATMQGTVIKVESDREEREGYYYFDDSYMEGFDGGSFDLEEGCVLPEEIDMIPEAEQEVLREDLFPPNDEDEESQSE